MQIGRLIAELEQSGVSLWAEDGILRFRAPQHVIETNSFRELRDRKSEATQYLEIRNASRLLPPRAKKNRPVIAPLSATQLAWWKLGVEGRELDHQVTVEVQLRGPIDAARLESAFRRVIFRNEILRTVYCRKDNRLVQVILPDCPVSFSVVQLGATSETEFRSRLDGEIGPAFRAERISLEHGPMLIARLVAVHESDPVLLLSFSRLAVDYHSQRILMQEILSLLNDLDDPDQDVLPFQYADFAFWEDEGILARRNASDQTFWKNRLANIPRTTLMCGIGSGPWRPASLRLPMHGIAPADLNSHELLQGADASVTLLAAANALFARWCGQEKIATGLFVPGRPNGAGPMIGSFASTQPLLLDIEGDPCFWRLVRQTAEGVLAAMNPRHGVSPTDICDHNLHRLILSVMRESGKSLAPQTDDGDMLVSPHADFFHEAAVSLILYADGIAGRLDFALEVLDQHKARCFALAFPDIIRRGCKNPQLKFSELLQRAS